MISICRTDLTSLSILALICLAAPAQATPGGPGENPPEGLSQADWSAIRGQLAPKAHVEETKLTASNATALDEFGYSVGISGDTVVVGARYQNQRSGAVYVFDRNHGGPNSWGQVRQLNTPAKPRARNR